MVSGYSSFGTLVQMGDGGGPETFSTIGAVGDIDGPDLSTDTEETTNQSSPGGVEEFIGTLKRTGEVTFPINVDPADPTHIGVAGLYAAWDNRTLKNWRMLWPSPMGSKRWNFSGIVVGLSQGAAVAGIFRWDVTIKVSGQPTIT